MWLVFHPKEISGISAQQNGTGFSVSESFHILFKFKIGWISPDSEEGETGRESEGFPPETGRGVKMENECPLKSGNLGSL